MEPSVFIGFALAIILGGLIGTERELPRTGLDPHNTMGFGGIRTFASIALLGAIAVRLDISLGTHIWTLFGAVMSGLLIIASYIYASFRQDKMGTTTEYAALITYFIGVIAMRGDYTFSIILAILYLLILSVKGHLEKLKDRFSRQELGDTLKFAVVSLLILPLLPDYKYSLLNIVNWFYHGALTWSHPILTTAFFDPYSIWLFVVILTGIEYVAFLLSKLIGSKGGIIVSGAIGGLISSTATTVAMTRKSTEYPENRDSYVVATLIASCIMFIRVVVIAGIIDPSLIDSIIIPALGMFISLLGITLYFYLFTRRKNQDVSAAANSSHEHESPFQLGSALKFAGLIIFIKFVSMSAIVYQSFIPAEVSNYSLGLISGLVDIDPLILTIAGESRSGLLLGLIASTTILIAVMSNNVVKASIAYRFGDKEYGKKVVIAFALSIIVGIIIITGMHFM